MQYSDYIARPDRGSLRRLGQTSSHKIETCNYDQKPINELLDRVSHLADHYISLQGHPKERDYIQSMKLALGYNTPVRLVGLEYSSASRLGPFHSRV